METGAGRELARSADRREMETGAGQRQTGRKDREMKELYIERIYAGWLAKIIGIRYGAPIEGWTYEKIRDLFGERMPDYPADYRLFAADDDSNGPWFFLRALEDGGVCAPDGQKRELEPEDVARALLNYAPFEHGFFWWGGYGVSTEHTAYLNLRNGIPAPESGSIRQNGSTMAEQIGGQIFSDTWGLVNPGKPERAARMARAAASVTHDGDGLNGAAFVASCISAAFCERDIRRVMETVLKYGARTAQPGEFTKRAFLNGRIDLSQAEAVADVISARNQYALKNSMEQLEGEVSRRVKELRSRILYEIARIESALDDPEHMSLDGYSEELLAKVEDMGGQVEKLIRSADDGRVMSEGIKTVILGKPNAGKSSLMNVLLGQERAIVTDVAGTTRDTLEEHIDLQGISLNVVDTAGIRDTEDVVERIGVERAVKAARDGDLIIYVVDGSRPLDKNDEEIIRMIHKNDLDVDCFVDQKVIVLLNKTDLQICVEKEELERRTGRPVIPVSAKEQQGIENLEAEIRRMFFGGELKFNEEVYITNIRHKEALQAALESLRMVENSIRQGLPEDFYSIDLTDAYESLGLIVGESVGDDVVNEIFSRFCMGK